MKWRLDWLPSAAADPRVAIPVSFWAGVALLNVVVWCRRISGAMTAPLPSLLVCASTLIVIIGCVAVRIYHASPRSRSLLSRLEPAEAVTLFLPISWGLSLSAGVSPFAWGGLIAAWALLGSAVILARVWHPALAMPVAEQPLIAETGLTAGPVDLGGSVPDGAALTDWQKRLVIDGQEVIEGEARVEFPAGMKEVMIHLAFAPPLTSVPEIHAEESQGADLEIRVEAAHTFGARLSVRRTTGVDATASHSVAYTAAIAEPKSAVA